MEIQIVVYFFLLGVLGGANIHDWIAGPVQNNACAVAAHWEQFALVGTVLAAGVNYIPNIIGDKNDPLDDKYYYVAYDVNGSLASYQENQTFGAEENPWTHPPEAAREDYSIYVNYTATAKKSSSSIVPLMMTLLEEDVI